MAKINFITGPCGTGKSTFANAYARHMVNKSGKTVYVIHGDDFHEGFVEPEYKGDFFVDGEASDRVLWEDILKCNWDCMMDTADRVLKKGIDVIIDYIIEDEMPRVKALAESNNAEFYYIVLTASEAELERRIRYRGDLDLIERAKFLKRKLEAMPENSGHIYDNTKKAADISVSEIKLADYKV